MKTLVAYSSITGNTKKIAEVITQAIGEGAHLEDILQKPETDLYDLIILGFWIDRARVNQDMAEFMSHIKDKYLAFFFTQVGWPYGPTAKRIIAQTSQKLVESNNILLGDFHCQGRMNPAIIKMARRLPVTHPRGGYSLARAALLAESQLHPDLEDLKLAGEFAGKVVAKYRSQISN